MQDKPLIFFDPYPRNEEMVYTSDVKKELNEISNLITHFGSKAPDHLIETHLSEVEIIVGQTDMLKERLDKSTKLKAIINVKCNWEPNIDYFEAQRRGIYVLSAAPAMAPAVAEACLGYAISLSRGTLGTYKKFLKSDEKYGIKGNINSYTLFNSDVGFIGFGNLAKSLLPLLKPFNCNISVYDPWLSKEYLESQGVHAVSLDILLSKNKFIFILAGVTSENEGFINKEKLELMITAFHEMIFWKFSGDPSTLTQSSRDIDQCVVSGTWIQKKGTQSRHGYDRIPSNFRKRRAFGPHHAEPPGSVECDRRPYPQASSGCSGKGQCR